MTDDDILNAIREKRFVTAKREVDSKISKFPQKNYYRALNAFYLLCIGSAKAALDECNELKKKVPSDPATLDLLHEIYCKLGKRNEAQSVYESAVKKYPSRDLILIWYNKSVQRFDAQMMHKSAAVLRKTLPSNRGYQLQSAFADYIWSSETKSEKESHQLLHSSSNTMEKLMPTQTNQELFLYASILLKKKEFSQVVRLLEGVENSELELTLLFLEALDSSENWKQLYQQSHVLLFEKSFNDYDTWKFLIRAGYALKKPFNELSSLIKFDSRNSYVANMELARVYGGDLDRAVEIYFEKFKTKPCCASDLVSFDLAHSFTQELRAKKTRLLQNATLSDDDVAICINLEKILSRCDNHQLDWDDFARHDSPKLSDVYLASMIQSLSQEISTTKIIAYIIRLERFAEEDPENFNVKLWLLNLYSTISGSSMGLETYDSLKIKMIQHDVISYKLYLEPSIKNLNQLTQIYRFYLTGENEITSYFGVALEKGLFTKLEDLYRFGKRLTTSISKHLLVLQISKMCRMLNNAYYSYFLDLISDIKAEVLSENFTVSDNRDFDTDYKLGFQFGRKVLFTSESKKTKEYVQLFYLKELLIAEKHPVEVEKLLRLLERWLGDSKYTNTLASSEKYFFKLFLVIFKATKPTSGKDTMQQINYLTTNLDFKNVIQEFLAKTSPLSSSANRILVDCLELVKVINLLSTNEALKVLSRNFQQDIVRYVVTNPEMTQFKEIKSSLELAGVPESFVRSQLERLEDGIRASKFKMR